jgi:hypothetical protein
LYLVPELPREFDTGAAHGQAGGLERLRCPGVAGVQRRIVLDRFVVAAVAAAGVRIRLDRIQGPTVLHQRLCNEPLQRGHLPGRQGKANDAIGAKDILGALRAETRHQHQPGAAPERRDHVARAAMQQVAPIAEAEQQVARVGKFCAHGLERRLQVRDRDADVHVPAPLDEIQC